MEKLGIINLETGEIIEDKVLFIGKRKRKDKDYIKVFVAFLEDIVENERISGKAVRLLLYMLRSLDYNSLTLTVIPKKAIEELGISEFTYHNWIKILIEEGIIQKIDRYTYKLKPFSFIKGDTSKTIEKEIERTERKRRKTKR